MFHQQIQLPEKHPDHPRLWQSLCGKWRIIRRKDAIQFIEQQSNVQNGAATDIM